MKRSVTTYGETWEVRSQKKTHLQLIIAKGAAKDNEMKIFEIITYMRGTNWGWLLCVTYGSPPPINFKRVCINHQDLNITFWLV